VGSIGKYEKFLPPGALDSNSRNTTIIVLI